MDKYRRYTIESPRTGGGGLLGFAAVIALTLGALVVQASEAPPRLAHTVYIEPAISRDATTMREPVEAQQATRNRAPNQSQAAPKEQDVALVCSIDACAQAYRSFRSSDCTFQPYEGPRRMCTR